MGTRVSSGAGMRGYLVLSFVPMVEVNEFHVSMGHSAFPVFRVDIVGFASLGLSARPPQCCRLEPHKHIGFDAGRQHRATLGRLFSQAWRVLAAGQCRWFSIAKISVDENPSTTYNRDPDGRSPW